MCQEFQGVLKYGSTLAVEIYMNGYTSLIRPIRPSVGSVALKCKSHYHLTDGKVEWLDKMS